MRRFLLALALVATFAFGVVGVATAQEIRDPVATDFIDPETGEIDFEAYLAAVRAAEEARRAAEAPRAVALPATGSSISDYTAVGAALVVVGGALVLSQRRRLTALAQRTRR